MSPQNQSPEQLPTQGYAVPGQGQPQSQSQPQFQFQGPVQPQQQGPAPMSRRGLLRGGLIGGGVGLAVAAGAGTAVGLTRKSPVTASLKPLSKPVVMAPMAPDATKGPLVVYISDASTGRLDVYGGTGGTQINNPALVAQILANLK